jgi:hypothetical protein
MFNSALAVDGESMGALGRVAGDRKVFAHAYLFAVTGTDYARPHK